MFCTDDEKLAERIRRLKFHGLGVDAFDRETQGRAPQVEVLEPGFKYNLPDMNAVLGLGQLARLKEMIRRRTALATLYGQLLADIDEIWPLALPQHPQEHAWNLFVIRVNIDNMRLDRDGFMAALKDRGIGTGLHFRAAHTHKFYQTQIPVITENLSNTEWNSERICSLPLFPDMHDADVHRVVAAIQSVLKEKK